MHYDMLRYYLYSKVFTASCTIYSYLYNILHFVRKKNWMKKRYNNNTSFEFGGRNFQIQLSTLSQRVKNRIRLINNKPETHNR